MRQCTRRRFLQSSLASAGLLAAAPRGLLAAPAQTPAGFAGTDIVPLGKTGIKVSRLAQGTGFNGYNHSSAHTRQGKEAFDRLMRHSLDSGITLHRHGRPLRLASLRQGRHQGPAAREVVLLTQALAAQGNLGDALRRRQGRRSIATARNSASSGSTSA